MENKDRILRVAKVKGQVTYKGRFIRIISKFSVESLKARRFWTDIMQTIRDQRCHPRLLDSVKFSITRDRENTIFHEKKIDLNNIYP